MQWSIVIAFIVSSVCAAEIAIPAPWRLLWKEDFNDLTQWKTALNNTSSLHYGVVNGSLVFSDDLGFTSLGTLKSEISFTFGRLVLSVSSPSLKGMSASVYLSSIGECFPVGNRVYAIQSFGDGLLEATLVYGECCGNTSACVQQQTFTFSGAGSSHVVWVDYMPDNITWYLDGKIQHTIQNTGLPKSYIDPAAHSIIIDVSRLNQTSGASLNIDYMRFYAYEPCATGGCQNGCCDNVRKTCVCNPGWTGSNCEYNLGGFNRSFVFDITQPANAIDECASTNANDRANVGYNAISNELVLSVQQNSTFCQTFPIQGAVWQSTDTAGYGTYSFRIKSNSILGTGLNLNIGWFDANFSSYYSYQIVVSPATPNEISAQYPL